MALFVLEFKFSHFPPDILWSVNGELRQWEVSGLLGVPPSSCSTGQQMRSRSTLIKLADSFDINERNWRKVSHAWGGQSTCCFVAAFGDRVGALPPVPLKSFSAF
ncbi:hypothetical protein NPIL_55811 [Nephila pilipes]|uniref:Uncharacterized protein n=1 Tax=Nephila pilipes TaxID=299642 RepID=A0A8X6NWZ7_NEPPI|nr:hypothetical protein NPIL_55811 [Nephila pilipes]